MYIGLYKIPNKALSCKQKNSSSFKSPVEGPPIPCTEMSSILYNVLKLKKPVNSIRILISTAT